MRLILSILSVRCLWPHMNRNVLGEIQGFVMLKKAAVSVTGIGTAVTGIKRQQRRKCVGKTGNSKLPINTCWS